MGSNVVNFPAKEDKDDINNLKQVDFEVLNNCDRRDCKLYQNVFGCTVCYVKG